MKPIRNRIYCFGCKRHKMLFEEQKKADNFIRFNKDTILEETGKAPVRSYYCVFCSGWHVTSNPSLEHGEEQDKRDLEIIETAVSVEHDILSFNITINNKINEIKRAIYLSIDDFNLHKEYEYCRLLLPELMRIGSSQSKSKLIIQVRMISDILSVFNEIKLMDYSELLQYIDTLNSNTEKTELIKRYALGKYIDLSLVKISELYNSGETDKAFDIKKDILIRLNEIEGIGKNKYSTKYKNKINATFEKLTFWSCNYGNKRSSIEKYKDILLLLINNLDIINDKFENMRFDECISLVDRGISELSKMPKDENVELILTHYRNWENTLSKI